MLWPQELPFPPHKKEQKAKNSIYCFCDWWLDTSHTTWALKAKIKSVPRSFTHTSSSSLLLCCFLFCCPSSNHPKKFLKFTQSFPLSLRSPAHTHTHTHMHTHILIFLLINHFVPQLFGCLPFSCHLCDFRLLLQQFFEINAPQITLVIEEPVADLWGIVCVCGLCVYMCM